MPWINRILVPIDLSVCSAAALRYAVFLSEHSGAKLHIVHVCEPSDSAALFELQQRRVHNQLQKMLDALPSHSSDHATLHVLAGEPAETIVRLAREQHVDLIVMGSGSEAVTNASHTGNVTLEVGAHAPCGVVPVHGSAAKVPFTLTAEAANDTPIYSTVSQIDGAPLY